MPDGEGYSYAFDRPLPEAARLLVPADEYDSIRTAASVQPNISVAHLPAGQLDTEIAKAVENMVSAREAGLPATLIRAEGTRKGLALFVSGDGGWRDLDKTIGEWMATQGFDVVGIDALRYFWSAKEPGVFARDLATLITAEDASSTLPVMLIGYSFGADVLPFAWAEMDPALQKRIQLIALLGPSPKASFQISLSGWLGLSPGTHDVVPAVAAIPPRKVLCVYGAEEKDSACVDPSLAAIPHVRTNGGHHFDGNYIEIGKKVLQAYESAAQ